LIDPSVFDVETLLYLCSFHLRENFSPLPIKKDGIDWLSILPLFDRYSGLFHAKYVEDLNSDSTWSYLVIPLTFISFFSFILTYIAIRHDMIYYFIFLKYISRKIKRWMCFFTIRACKLNSRTHLCVMTFAISRTSRITPAKRSRIAPS